MRTDVCPDSNTLEMLLLGKLPSPACESLSEHLLHCNTCVALAETITASDEFTAALQAPRLVVGEDEHLTRAIQHALELRSEAETVGSDDTVEKPGTGAGTPKSSSAAAASFDPIGLLRPAEEHDEIGRLADYRVLEVMGAGGMGVVFRAEDPNLKRHVVLKVMKPAVASSPQAKERFLREAQATAAIDHDHIVHIYQVGEDHGVPYIAMQLLRGESLQARLTREGRLAQREVLRIGREVAVGLAAAHQCGLIHRDIKPDNLWIEEGTGRVKILDFGLVRSVDSDAGLTQSEMVLGTPRYMAPEQALGIDVDYRCDLFSLGSVLYHLAGGCPPFDEGNLTATLIAVAHHQPKPITEQTRDLCPDLAKLIMRLLEKEPDARPQAATDVANELTRIEGALGSKVNLSAAGNETAPWPAASDDSKKSRRGLPKWVLTSGALVAVALGVFLALWSAGIIFKVKTPDGTVVVTIDGSRSAIPVSVAEDQSITIRDPNDGRPIVVTVDRVQKQLRLEKAGFAMVVKQFSLESPKGDRIHVEFVPDKTVKSGIKSQAPTVGSSDPNLITVAQDGSAQYRTISKALDQAEPGMTIRVVDGGVYSETLNITGRRHSRVTLETNQGATISLPPVGIALIMIRNVEGFTLRGFRLRLTRAPSVCCVVAGASSMVTLDNVTFEGNEAHQTNGISIEGLKTQTAEFNLLIRECDFKQLGLGVRISGIGNDYRTAITCKSVLVIDSRFSENYQAITAIGDVRDVTIAGNQITDSFETGIQLQNLVEGAENIQVLNNTMVRCAASFQLWDTMARGDEIRLINNLTLDAEKPDWSFIDNGGSAHQAKGAGDGPSVLSNWELASNWREDNVKVDVASPGYIPPSTKDVVRPSLNLASRNPDDAGYLRPQTNSPLATSGAGTHDSLLPRYVGAHPPIGTQRWNWLRRQLANTRNGVVITVSKTASDTGQFKTLGEALEAAKPWSTIRVLDDATYEESLVISDSALHRGITLEALAGATIRGVSVSNVSHVVLRGFRIEATRNHPQILVRISGGVGGGILDALEFIGLSNQSTAVLLTNPRSDANQDPFVIQRCRFSGSQAISIRGTEAQPAAGVCVRENHIVNGAEGIELQGVVQGIHVVGNTVRNCISGGIDLQDVEQASRDLLIANNTVFGCGVGFVVFDPDTETELAAGPVVLAGNLFFEASMADMVFLRQPSRTNPPFPGDGQRIERNWQLRNNWRDMSGAEAANGLPLAEFDRSATAWEFASREIGHADYMRPTGADLMTGGAGGDLPGYAGAIAPHGTRAWDWDKVWRRRALSK